MADFSKQWVEKNDPNMGWDFDIEAIAVDMKPGTINPYYICEGLGCVAIGKDENGVVHDCKRRKHQLNHQLSEDFLLDWCALQRQTKARIEDALTAHGDEVTVDILDAYNINLHDNIRFYFNSGATYVEFLDYNIIIRPNFKTLKIQKNEKSGLLKDDRKTA